jgi:L-alanine-DL-glutamate epimerase-like enolase superfamily enzyme
MRHIANPHHVRIAEVECHFSVEHPAGTFSFGAATTGDLTLAHVRVRVEDRAGRSATGWGAIFLSHPWAYPVSALNGPAKNELMKGTVVALGNRLAGSDLWGHPLDHLRAIEPELPVIASTTAAAHGVTEAIPPLFSLVSLSPIDAAIHDAYGNLHGRPSYATLGADHLDWDLGDVLGNAFKGRYPGEFLRQTPESSVPVSHTVGALDPLTSTDAGTIPPLEEWVRRDMVWSFKVKLKGRDLEWDLARLREVHRIATAADPGHDVRVFADLNEQAPDVAYILEILDRLHAESPQVARALDALEQPLSRNLGPEASSLETVSARVPVVLDEGLVSLAALEQALALGWSGIALKTCKTQSLMLLALPRAIDAGLHVSVQDLTNPGIALIQSAGLAARLPQTRPIEANARQYYPATSAPEATVFPALYTACNGHIITGDLDGPGLGYRVDRIPRDLFRDA